MPGRPDDFCAVTPKVTRVTHHEERRTGINLLVTGHQRTPDLLAAMEV